MAENTKKWEETGRRYRTYIKLEKRLSENTVESYMRDLRQFAHFILRQYDVTPRKVERTMIERYMGWLFERGREKTSQARCLCGIRSFFNFLLISDQIEASPAEFVDTPKFGRHLPDVLTTAEIDRIIATVDTRTTKGIRDSAMLEVLYSCGLRVSELTSLRLSDLFFGEGYIRVIGKGDKQRLVPISTVARDKIQRYLEERRSARSGEEVVFLNNRGGQLTRDGLHDPEAGRPTRRHRQTHQPAYVPALVRHAPARRGRQYPAGTGDARTRKHPHHRNLYAPRQRPPAPYARRAPRDIGEPGPRGRRNVPRMKSP